MGEIDAFNIFIQSQPEFEGTLTDPIHAAHVNTSFFCHACYTVSLKSGLFVGMMWKQLLEEQNQYPHRDKMDLVINILVFLLMVSKKEQMYVFFLYVFLHCNIKLMF